MSNGPARVVFDFTTPSPTTPVRLCVPAIPPVPANVTRTYGQSVSWTDRAGQQMTLTVRDYATPEQAQRAAFASAARWGWTPSRWWQWWRWEDTPNPPWTHHPRFPLTLRERVRGWWRAVRWRG